MIRKFCAVLVFILVTTSVVAQDQLVLGTFGTQTLDFTEYFENDDGTFDGIGIKEEWNFYGGEYHNFQARGNVYLGAAFEIGQGTVNFCVTDGCVEQDIDTWFVGGFLGAKTGNLVPFISLNASTIDVDSEGLGFDANLIADRGEVEWDVDLGMWFGGGETKFRLTADRLLSQNDIHRTVSLATFFPVMNDYIGSVEFSYPVSTEAEEESLRIGFSIGMYF